MIVIVLALLCLITSGGALALLVLPRYVAMICVERNRYQLKPIGGAWEASTEDGLLSVLGATPFHAVHLLDVTVHA